MSIDAQKKEVEEGEEEGEEEVLTNGRFCSIFRDFEHQNTCKCHVMCKEMWKLMDNHTH